MSDYKEIPIPDEIDEKIKSLSDRLDFAKLNKKQWDRLNSILISLHTYITIYKEEITNDY